MLLISQQAKCDNALNRCKESKQRRDKVLPPKKKRRNGLQCIECHQHYHRLWSPQFSSARIWAARQKRHKQEKRLVNCRYLVLSCVESISSKETTMKCFRLTVFVPLCSAKITRETLFFPLAFLLLFISPVTVVAKWWYDGNWSSANMKLAFQHIIRHFNLHCIKLIR